MILILILLLSGHSSKQRTQHETASYQFCWLTIWSSRTSKHSNPTEFQMLDACLSRGKHFGPSEWWGMKWNGQTELDLMCGPGVSPKGKKGRRTEKKREAFKYKGSRGMLGKEEGMKGAKRGKEMEGRAVCKLQKAPDCCCCCRRQPWPLYRCFCSPLSP